MLREPPNPNELSQGVFRINNEKAFEQIALQIFNYQFLNNAVYCDYCTAIGIDPAVVKTLGDIPFLPIQFFKNKLIRSGTFEPQAIFKSSGTTNSSISRHLIKNMAIYEESFSRCFEMFYGPAGGRCILGLLPSYLEQGASSLVYMVNHLIKRSGHPASGFYLYNLDQLHQTIKQLERAGEPAILFGVSYALLDFAEAYPTSLKHTTIIETGGMKGRKKELTKEALYETLQNAFGHAAIHSEYGMTELLSQAYAINGRYKTPPWMKIFLRDETDPFSRAQKTGVINIIDLANIYSCCFIATDDRGRVHENGSFEVLGRMDHADVRGCSQLVL